MDKKYVASNRYKKTTKNKVKKEKDEVQRLTKKYNKISKEKKENKYIKEEKRNNKNNKKNKNKKNNKEINIKSARQTKLLNDAKRKKMRARKKKLAVVRKIAIVCLLLILLLGIYYVCKVGVNNIPEQIQNVFKQEEKKTENITEVKIGLNKITNEYPLLSKSIYLKELNTYVYPPIIKIDEKYNIQNILVDKIEKISNKEYMLYVKQDYIVTAEDIKATIEEYIKSGDKTIYFRNVKNIEKIEQEGVNLKILLKEEDPYYIYNLNIPIISKSYLQNKKIEELNNKKGYIYDINTTDENKIIYQKSDPKYNEYPKKLDIEKFERLEDMVNSFKDGTIDMFYTSNSNVIKLLGKQEYSLKTYNNGENIFMFGNKDSHLFKQIEIRKALAYSINKEEIIKNILGGGASIIDLPYIYDEVKYRYDKTAGENILLNNGWSKISGIYNKTIDNKTTNARLTLIVNGDDEILNKVADLIKSDTEDIGIIIDIERLTQKNLQKRIETKSYDLILANINLSESPDISFISNYININENINTKVNEINSCNLNDLSKKVQELKNILSEEVATIGIAAKTTNMIYNKKYTKIENIWYNNVFKKLETYNNSF